MDRPKLLDLFCCEGGASEGYRRAGFDVYGIDLFEDYTQKRYPFPSRAHDALDAMDILLTGSTLWFDNNSIGLRLKDFAAITASPPCQKYSITNAARKANYPDLVGPIRALLIASGKPYVIENVVGAPLVNPVELCGCMFDLKAVDTDGILLHMQRARLFESNVPLVAPGPHDHSNHEWVAGSYGGARRDKYEAKYVRKGGYVPSIPVQQALLGIDWMTQKGMHQSIPPAYTEFIGRQLINHSVMRTYDNAG